MKSFKLLVLLYNIEVFAASLGGYSAHSKRQAEIFNWRTWLNGAGGKVVDPPVHAPRREVLTSELPGAKRIKIRSGPYNVPHMGVKSRSGHAGMLENHVDTAIEKPCPGECVILRQRGGLEFVDGTNANVDKGLWLHHMIQFNTGDGRWDPVGYGQLCVPHLSIASLPSRSERFYVTGNERFRVDHLQGDDANVKDGSGYRVQKDDKFTYIVELMNMNMENKVVYLTMTYDIIDGPLPAGWKETKSIFLDADSCKWSEIVPPKETGDFVISSEPWTPNVEGKIISATGHVHDGGIGLDIKVNAARTLCKTTAVYAGSPEFVFRGSVMGPDKVATEHISSMPGCERENLAATEMKRNQAWSVDGMYDFSKREGNLEHGKQAEIMAISMVVIAVEPNVKPIT